MNKISTMLAIAVAMFSATADGGYTSTPPTTPLAQSTFNSPPFTVGITVDGQGGSEPGWAAPWQELGGFSDRGHVVSSPTYEGNGAVQLFADQNFGTSVEREWADIVPVVRVDSFVFVTAGCVDERPDCHGDAGFWRNRHAFRWGLADRRQWIDRRIR